jgi:ABC-type uncharacterized transport system substrate-binding protein
LAQLKVDLIVAAGGNFTASATKQATATIPIVATNMLDPVGSGFVANWHAPAEILQALVRYLRA